MAVEPHLRPSRLLKSAVATTLTHANERRPSLWTPDTALLKTAQLKRPTQSHRCRRGSSPTEMTTRRTLRGETIPDAPPPDSEWPIPDEVIAKLPDVWSNALQSVENSGVEFSYYCRRYQNDTATPYQTMSGLLASWEILDRNLADLTEAVGHLSEEQKTDAGGEAGLDQVREALAYRKFYVDEYRDAMSKLAREGVPAQPDEDAMT